MFNFISLKEEAMKILAMLLLSFGCTHAKDNSPNLKWRVTATVVESNTFNSTVVDKKDVKNGQFISIPPVIGCFVEKRHKKDIEEVTVHCRQAPHGPKIGAFSRTCYKHDNWRESFSQISTIPGYHVLIILECKEK